MVKSHCCNSLLNGLMYFEQRPNCANSEGEYAVYAFHYELSCLPCFRRTDRQTDEYKCMDHVVDVVITVKDIARMLSYWILSMLEKII